MTMKKNFTFLKQFFLLHILIKVKERSIDVTFSNGNVLKNKTLKICEQLEIVKRQKREELYQFKSKQPYERI